MVEVSTDVFICVNLHSVSMLRPFSLLELAEFVLHCGIGLHGMLSSVMNYR